MTHYYKKTYKTCSHSLSFRNIFCFIKVHNWIIPSKIDLILANKLCKDDMKIIQLFHGFPLQTLHEMNATYVLFVLFSGEKTEYYNWKENDNKKKIYFSSANEKMLSKFVKIMHRFCFKRCFKRSFSTRVKTWKKGFWRGLFYRLLNMGSAKLIENGTHGRG